MGAYATVADVQARLAYWTIDVSSQPSSTQVSAWIDEAESMLIGALQAGGNPSTYATTDATRQLRAWASDYAEGRVRMAHVAAAGNGENQDGKDLVMGFKDLLKDIISRPSIYGAMLAGGDAPSSAGRLRSYATHNADSASIEDGDFTPTFTRSEVF